MRDAGRLQEFIRGASRLPVPPKVTLRLLSAMDSADSTANDIAAIIEADPSLAARLLKLANSSFYGQCGRISTVRNAVLVLGSRTIRSLALMVWTHTLRSQATNAAESMLAAPLLAHGVAAGVAAGMLAAKIEHGRGEDAFMAGLLHDIGRVALVAQMGRQYQTAILEPAARAGRLLHEEEGAVLGFDHRDLGSALMASWGLPPFLAEVAERHHDSDLVPGKQLVLAAVVLADVVSTRLGFNVALATPRPQREEIAAYFGLPDEAAVAEFQALCAGWVRSFGEALE